MWTSATFETMLLSIGWIVTDTCAFPPAILVQCQGSSWIVDEWLALHHHSQPAGSIVARRVLLDRLWKPSRAHTSSPSAYDLLQELGTGDFFTLHPNHFSEG